MRALKACFVVLLVLACDAGFGGENPATLAEREKAKTLLTRASKITNARERSAAYDQLIRNHSASEDWYVRERVLGAMERKAAMVESEAEKAALYDRMLELGRGTEFTTPYIRRVVAWAIVAKTASMDDCAAKGRLLDELLINCRDSTDPKMVAYVVKALLAKADCEENDDRAAAMLDEIVAKYGDTDDPVLQAGVANALNKMAERVSDKEVAAALFLEVISRYGGSRDEATRKQVDWAGKALAGLQEEMKSPGYFKKWKRLDAGPTSPEK